MIRRTTFAFALPALLLLGCESSQDAAAPATTSMGVVNDTCPFSGHAVNSDAKTVRFDGAEVGFCCNGCVERWGAKTDAEKADLLATVRD